MESAGTDFTWKEVEYKELLSFLLNERGFSPTRLRDRYLLRRISLRLYSTRCSSVSDYLRLIKKNECELNKLYDALTINVSSFFRNQRVFDCLREKIFPEIIKQKIGYRDNSINILSAGCSTGEEPYSIGSSYPAISQNKDEKVPNSRPGSGYRFQSNRICSKRNLLPQPVDGP